MAAAAAGAGAGTAQEKQFPPALLSFFIYNPRFGPREGEVRGTGPRAGGSRRSEEDPRAGAAGPTRGGPGQPWGRGPGWAGGDPAQHLSLPSSGGMGGGFVSGVRPGQGISGGQTAPQGLSLESWIKACVLNEGSAG